MWVLRGTRGVCTEESPERRQGGVHEPHRAAQPCPHGTWTPACRAARDAYQPFQPPAGGTLLWPLS